MKAGKRLRRNCRIGRFRVANELQVAAEWCEGGKLRTVVRIKSISLDKLLLTL